jgi:preprotein translocase subunit SecE
MVEKIKSIFQFLSGVNREFSRVTWPSRSELIGSTIVVLVLVVFFSLYLGFIDFVLAQLAARIF